MPGPIEMASKFGVNWDKRRPVHYLMRNHQFEPIRNFQLMGAHWPKKGKVLMAGKVFSPLPVFHEEDNLQDCLGIQPTNLKT